MSTTKSNDLVITGLGCLTAAGQGLDAHWAAATEGRFKNDAEGYSLKGFKPAPHLSDRRLLKAVSPADALGLVAIEGLKKTLKLDPRPYTPERTGLYVGAPPASAFDNAYYTDAMEASRDGEGRARVKEFGATCMSAMPMTLLVGLPNNVLCYGAMILDAKGPNSNYTAVSTGGHMALMNAARRVRRGQLDLAVGGGFSMHTEAVNHAMFRDLGLTATGNAVAAPFSDRREEQGWVVADGAAFVAVEKRAAAEARGADVLATYLGGALASDGRGPLEEDKDGTALEAAIHRALAEAGLTPSDIGLVLAGATGLGPSDVSEFSVLSRVFANVRDCPAVGSSQRVLGHLLEAGGLIEIGLAANVHATGALPRALLPGGYAADSQFATRVPRGKPHTLIVRTSPWGESSVIIVGHCGVLA